MKYKGLLLDFDRTTVRKIYGSVVGQELSKRVETAIRGVRKKIKVGFCTGKKFFDIAKEVGQLDLVGPHIVCGGAQLVDKKGKAMWERLIPAKISRKVYEAFNSKGKLVEVKHGNYNYVANDKVAEMVNRYSETVSFETIDKLPTWTVPQMVVAGLTDVEADELEGMGVYAARQKRPDDQLWFADVTAHGVTKQEGILQWLKHTGLKREEVVGVGDGYNDVPMLNAVGLKIAMGNAVEEVKAMADFVAPSVDEDGVATVIEKFFDN